MSFKTILHLLSSLEKRDTTHNSHNAIIFLRQFLSLCLFSSSEAFFTRFIKVVILKQKNSTKLFKTQTTVDGALMNEARDTNYVSFHINLMSCVDAML